MTAPRTGFHPVPGETGPLVKLPNGSEFPEWADVRIVWPQSPTSPMVSIRLEVKDDRPVPTGFAIVSPTHDEVPSKWVQALPVTDIVSAAIREVGNKVAGDHLFGDGARWWRSESWERFDSGRETAKRLAAAHRRRVTPELLQRVANIYRSDRSGRPTEAVAKTLTYSHRNATRLVALAREAGLLEPYKRGER